MLFLNSVKDAFSNPDSPWYYAIGSVFLVLIIAAIVIFMAVSKKRANNKDAASTDEEANTENNGTVDADDKQASDADISYETTKDTEAEQIVSETDVEKEPVSAAAEVERSDVEEETVNKGSEETEPESEKPAETVEPQRQEDDPVADMQEEPADNSEPIAKPKKTPAKKTVSAAKKQDTPVTATESGSVPTPVKKTAAKKTTSKKADKPFIDRLIAAKPVHGVYNVIKNTVLSYPGIKAKLTKDDERFFFGTDVKAAITLDGESITLRLSLERDKVPSQFNVFDGDGDLPTAMTVGETETDAVQRLIMFAMNVSLLTRNDRHRYTDYVQKAVDAKKRANKK